MTLPDRLRKYADEIELYGLMLETDKLVRAMRQAAKKLDRRTPKEGNGE